jgi:hypothetical protein
VENALGQCRQLEVGPVNIPRAVISRRGGPRSPSCYPRWCPGPRSPSPPKAARVARAFTTARSAERQAHRAAVASGGGIPGQGAGVRHPRFNVPC